MFKILDIISSLFLKKDKELENKVIIKNNFCVYSILVILSLLIFIGEVIFNIKSTLIPIIFFMISFISMSITINECSKNKFEFIDYTFFYILIAATSFAIINKILNIFSSGIILFILKAIFLIVIYVCIFFMRKKYKNSEFYSDKCNSIEPTEEVQVGDHIIGKDVENGSIVKIPLHDRFVHTLIIGSTGTGKTSQILLPMINRDLQNKDIGSIIIEPKGDLAEQAYALALMYGRKAMFFNPMTKDAPYFNPLYGNEDDVIENLATAFRMLDPDSAVFFQNQAENLIRKALKVLKRLYGNDATLIDLNTLLWNTDNEGRKILVEFNKKVKPSEMKAENDELYNWFMSDYFTGCTGDRTATKTYEHTSGIRTQVAKLVSNKYLRKVLNPPKGVGTDIDFVRALENCEVVCITTAQGDLQALSSYLGYFLILQLQAAVFKRPGDEDSRKPCVLTIDEFQVFANPGFSNMMTQGRSYRVPCVLATQNLALIGMNSGRQGKDFSDLVKSNARNLIVFPGCNYQDADYFSKLFGEDYLPIEKITRSRHIFNPVMNWGLKAPSESVNYSEEKRPRFTPTEIINMQFTEVICRLINGKSVMPARKCKVSFIDKELKQKVDELVQNFKNENYIDKEEEYQKNKSPNIYTENDTATDNLKEPVDDAFLKKNDDFNDDDDDI
ncbi:type IV secretory system conjugative DNA transfer family protein [Clostridium sp.]|uniref:type IV secretory system conjugative DNA transfer family protein n=1 Tax=Clostridium sp. TaxID=1506 RepID=UPI001B73F73F|nr:type IV secretory system conjugative DNA transfer family protein [Clostridium sp.]MBP3915713.1 type IV secretory system conjugative DNA transfer family protein [Clostridium sp.]